MRPVLPIDPTANVKKEHGAVGDDLCPQPMLKSNDGPGRDCQPYVSETQPVLTDQGEDKNWGAREGAEQPDRVKDEEPGQEYAGNVAPRDLPVFEIAGSSRRQQKKKSGGSYPDHGLYPA